MSSSTSLARRRVGATVAAIGLLAAGSIVGSIGVPDLVSAQTAGAVASVVVTVEPTRILDTRSGVGLPGTFAANTSQKLQVTGSVPTRIGTDTIDQTVVPDGATGVLLNVTALRPTAQGFISIRPGDASGEPSSSNLNASPGQVVPNAVTVALASNGTIDIWYGTGDSSASTGLLIDVVGYTAPTVGSAPGPAGPAGPAGAPGTDLYERTVIVNSGSDAATNGARLTSALTQVEAVATAANPWLVILEPGSFDVDELDVPDHVRLDGSGIDHTSINVDGDTTSGNAPTTIAGLSITTDLFSTNGDIVLERVDLSGPLEVTASDATLIDSVVNATSNAVTLFLGDLTISGSSITSDDDAVTTLNSDVTIESSVVLAPDAAISLSSSNPTYRTLTLIDSVVTADRGISLSGRTTTEVTRSEIDARTSITATGTGTTDARATITHSIVDGDSAFSGTGTMLEMRVRQSEFNGTVAATTASCLDVINSLSGFWFQSTCP